MYCRRSWRYIRVCLSTMCHHSSKPRLDFFLRIPQRPCTPRSSTPDAIGLRRRETARFDGRVVADVTRGRDVVVRLPVSTLVHRADHRAAQAKVMLQCHRGACDQPVSGPATELPDELGALGDARGAEWMAFGNEAAGRIDDAAAPVGDVPVADHLVRFSGLAQTQGVERNHLVGGETVVQLADFDVPGGNAGLGQSGLSRVLGHVESHERDGAAVEE